MVLTPDSVGRRPGAPGRWTHPQAAFGSDGRAAAALHPGGRGEGPRAASGIVDVRVTLVVRPAEDIPSHAPYPVVHLAHGAASQDQTARRDLDQDGLSHPLGLHQPQGPQSSSIRSGPAMTLLLPLPYVHTSLRVNPPASQLRSGRLTSSRARSRAARPRPGSGRSLRTTPTADAPPVFAVRAPPTSCATTRRHPHRGTSGLRDAAAEEAAATGDLLRQDRRGLRAVVDLHEQQRQRSVGLR